MIQSSTITFRAPDNEQALSTLSRAIRLSEGQFALILVRCNYLALQEKIWCQYQENSPLKVKEVWLSKSVTTLFTTLHTEMGTEPISALAVFALESVQALDQVIEATNQVREEFRKNLPFPLVLWVTDEVLQKLAKFAPDFKSWASASIKFELPTPTLVDLWEKAVNHLFDRLLDAGAAQFLNNYSLNLAPGCRHRRELEYARSDLRSCGVSLSPASEATWQFILGRDAYSNNQIEQALEKYQHSVDFWQEEADTETNQLTTDKIGILLFHIGLCYCHYATQQLDQNLESWQQAKECFSSARDIFALQMRRKWVAQLTIHLGFVLEQLQNWDELQSLALEFLLEPTNGNSTLELAQAYGFLAQAALAKSNSLEARLLAQTALKMLDQSLFDGEYYERALYLLLLAKAQYQLGEYEQAINHLQKARKVALYYADGELNSGTINPDKSLRATNQQQLYLNILEELRRIYFEKQQYQLAFEIKQEKLAVEQNCGLRAFLGANPLPSPRQQSGGSQLKSQIIPVSPEAAIVASGRQRDVHYLLERLSRSEHKLTVIHGSSGVGKSSLLRAGLLPALRGQIIAAREVLPVLYRIGRDWEQDLQSELIQALGEMEKLEERYCPPGQSSAILQQLKSLSESKLLTVLIFDQFEEFFFICTETGERRKFYDFIRECLNLPYVKIILSLREDYLHHLLAWEKYGTLEAINNNILDRQVRYPLGDLTCEQATRVIKSLAVQSKFDPQDSLIATLVKDLAKKSGTVRPIELQVVGAQLQAERITTLEQYQQLGEDPKATLVERSLATVIADCGEENEHLVWQILFLLTNDKGTRPLRTQAELSVGLSRLQEQKGHQLPQDNYLLLLPWHTQSVPQSNDQEFLSDYASVQDSLNLILFILVGSGLVFRVREQPEDRYQLVHDYLVEPIRQHYQQRLQIDIESQLSQTQSELVRVRRQRVQAWAVGVTMGLLAMAAGSFGWWASQQTKLANKLSVNAELAAMSTSAQALLADNKPFDALLEALRAAHYMQQRKTKSTVDFTSQPRSFDLDPSLIETATQLQVITTLEQGLYSNFERNRLEGHSDIVWDVSFAPNGELIASASQDHTIKLWQSDGKLVSNLIGHEETVTSVTFSPDSQRIASSSWDGTVRLWGVNSQPLAQINAHRGHVYKVTFSPNGQRMASAGEDGQVKIWTAKGQLLLTLWGHRGKVTDVSFSPDGQWIASAGEDQTVRIWSTTTGQLTTILRGHQAQVNGIAFSPQGEILLTASDDYTVRIWERLPHKAYRYRWSKTLRGESAWKGVAFSPDGQTIAASSDNHEVRLWRLDGTRKLSLRGHNDAVNQISFSPDGITLASSSSDKTLKIWYLPGLSRIILSGHRGKVHDVTFSPDGNLIASGSADKTLKIWTRDGRLLHTLLGHQDIVESISFAPNGNLIASASRDQTIKIWSLDGRLLKTLNDHSDWIMDVIWSPDGQLLASAGRDQTIKIWSSSGQLLSTLTGHRDRVNSLAFSPDGLLLASGSDDKTIKLWSTDEEGDFYPHPVITINGHNGWVLDVSFTPDGQRIASASYDNTVKFWQLDGIEDRTLKDHTDSVARLAFSPLSPQGEFLATATWDNQLKVWRSDDTLLQSLEGHEDNITSVSWSANGQEIATASKDQTIIVWNLDVEDLTNLSCRWLKDYFTHNSQVRESDHSLCQ